MRTSIIVADDIQHLKQEVQTHLNIIRESVEKNKHAGEEAEKNYRQEYDSMINELTRSKDQADTLRQQLEVSRTQLLRDTLTGISNRLAYDERIGIEFNRWKRENVPLCLAMWDIDNFKHINDTYGHVTGDKVLKIFSTIIVNRVRKTDMFARIGGEEFVLMMPNTNVDTGMALNDQLRKALEHYKFYYKNELCPVTASVGIAEFVGNLDADEVLQRADKALYVSKHSGKNRCTIYKDNNNVSQ